ncbi:hypothetical protein GGS20DRAFT_491028 [Poronia punctata]|nr:hypothetical protein GGS20DRAFT_491028 [Poronia punctata]
MDNELEDEARQLRTGLSSFTAQFSSMGQTHSNKQLSLQHNLAQTTSDALDKLMSLAKLVVEDIENKPPEAIIPVVDSLAQAWQAARDASAACLDEIRSFSVEITQFHDRGLGEWQDRAKKLQAEEEARLQAQFEESQTQQQYLHQIKSQAAASLAALQVAQEKLDEQRHKYDSADKWTWFFPPARLALEGVKALIEALSHAQEGAEREVKITTQQVVSAQRLVADAQQKVEALRTVMAKEAETLAQGEALMGKTQALKEETQKMEIDVDQTKEQRFKAWEVISKCLNRAQGPDYAPTNAEYATVVLEVAAVALTDFTLRSKVGLIVQYLKEHDDATGTIANIRTEEHPDGLLKYVLDELAKGVPGDNGSLALETPETARFNLLRLAARKLTVPGQTPLEEPLSGDMEEKLLHFLKNLWI